MNFTTTTKGWHALSPWQRWSAVLLVLIYAILIGLLLWFRPTGSPTMSRTEPTAFKATDPYYQHYYYYWGQVGQSED